MPSAVHPSFLTLRAEFLEANRDLIAACRAKQAFRFLSIIVKLAVSERELRLKKDGKKKRRSAPPSSVCHGRPFSLVKSPAPSFPLLLSPVPFNVPFLFPFRQFFSHAGTFLPPPRRHRSRKFPRPTRQKSSSSFTFATHTTRGRM